MTILVTGGAGFIGSNFILRWLALRAGRIVNLDKVTYAGNLANLTAIERDPSYVFVQGDIADAGLVRALLKEHCPSAILNFAAESHVDRSILGPEEFVQTNIVGTARLLDCARDYWRGLSDAEKAGFRFLQVSTDEVYGSLEPEEASFNESTSYAPNSPYAASKAAADHLVRAYGHTYGLPTLITNCSNNYGPYQFPEKLIPLTIVNAMQGRQLPVYGDGQQCRDWLYVLDHCNALTLILKSGRVGEKYNIGGRSEVTNLQVVHAICDILDEVRPAPEARRKLIRFVTDRPGHDRRYSVNCDKLERELGWRPETSLAEGLRQTVSWYLQNDAWVSNVTSGTYREWTRRQYASV